MRSLVVVSALAALASSVTYTLTGYIHVGEQPLQQARRGGAQ